ncbi:MAG: hypothetical protein GWM90_04590, partial [Gemmatimonadetes bacterium]|nr:hypothetical protein [Gemmatimonadota bacterium]NIQ52970.1 hypothetical protein [Gemmatimonadota bacterium]NIU73105.1 hypothetical protein [Gammaproteobacteria bacterium]NIX43421.1 hypothetical protein [Gemmatimonadota bacterium]
AGLATGVEILDDLGGLRQIDAWLESVFSQGAALGVTGALVVGAGLVIGFIVLGWLV